MRLMSLFFCQLDRTVIFDLTEQSLFICIKQPPYYLCLKGSYFYPINFTQDMPPSQL